MPYHPLHITSNPLAFLLTIPSLPSLTRILLEEYHSFQSFDGIWCISARMTLKGGSSHACAACKFQRRKCSSECLLAHFFPSDNPKQFQNAHKLFGVRNIVKIIKPLTPFERCQAMNSIIFESNMREEYPVHGCCEPISRLEAQLRLAQAELNSFQAQLAFFRQNQEMTKLPLNATVVDFDSMYPDKDEMVNSYCIHNNPDNNNETDMKLIQPQIDTQVVPIPIPIQEQEAQDYDEIHPFFDVIDDRQSFIDCKDANDSSSDSSLKHTEPSIEFVADNELKNAAAHFSLTSVN